MKREIKFRGMIQDSPTDEWVYGNLIHYENGEVSILEQPFSKYGSECSEMLKRTRVLPNSVGQYTGLKDKWGKEIYDGDIVEYYTNSRVYIGLIGSYEPDFIDIHNKNLLPCKWNFERYSKLLGNIYENPELLKQSQND